MATKRDNEAVEDNAYKALEDALAIDFQDGDGKSARSEDAARPSREELARSLSPEAAPKSPQFKPANDQSGTRASRLGALPGAAEGGSPMRIAALISVAWVALMLVAAHLLYAPAIWEIRSVEQFAAVPGAISLIVATIFPVAVFFAFAVMIARARELRHAARTMAEVALRLAEPENAAADRIMTVGQAVRRQVTAMNEGIERTIARAAELESLVHSEVSALERSYTDNEMRVRNLVQELGSEREAIVGHAERVRSSIAGAHEHLKEELAAASLGISRNIATSGEAVAKMIDTQAAIFIEKTGLAADSIDSLLTVKTENLLSALSSSGVSLTNEFDSRIDMLSSTLQERGKALLADFETRASMLDANTEKLNHALHERTKQLNETLIARTKQINESLTSGAETITSELDGVLASLNAALDEKGASFRQTMKSTADDAVMDLDVRTSFFDERLRASIDIVSSAFDSRLSEFTTAFDERSGTLDTKLSDSLARINESLGTGRDALDGILGSSLDRLNTAFAGQSVAMETALGTGQEMIEMALDSRFGQISETLGKAHQQIEAGFGGKADDMVAKITGSAEAITSAVNSGHDRISSVLDEKSARIEAAFSENHQRLETAVARGTELITGNVEDARTRLAHSANIRRSSTTASRRAPRRWPACSTARP
jgi:hypothetical protein